MFRKDDLYVFTFKDRNILDPDYESVFKINKKQYLSPFKYVLENKPETNLEASRLYAIAYANKLTQDNVFKNLLKTISEKYIVYNLENNLFLGANLIYNPISREYQVNGNNLIGKILTCLKTVLRNEKRSINLDVGVILEDIKLPEIEIREITEQYKGSNVFFNLSNLLYYLEKYDDVTTIISSNIYNALFGLWWKCIGKRRTLLFPDNFENDFIAFLRNDSKRFLILPLTLQDIRHCYIPQPNPQTDHTNMLLYDKETGILERFEPHGYTSTRYPEFYNTSQLDIELDLYFKNPVFKVSKYLSPIESCPELGPQILETSEKLLPNVGFCTIWSYWYINLRLANPYITNRVLLQNLAIQKIKKNGLFFTKYIYSFAMFLKDIEKDILKKLPPFYKEDERDTFILEMIREKI